MIGMRTKSRPDKERLSPDEVRAMFAYDPGTGELTRKDRGHGIRPGRVTAGKNREGYRIVNIKDRLYLTHRLVWVVVHGEWPAADLDHANGDRADNRIANLREATRSLNNANAKRPRHNTSGYKGVIWHAAARKWMAQIKYDKKNHYLGLYEDPVLAHAAYVKAHNDTFGVFSRTA